MRCASTFLLLAAALGAPCACFAQAQERTGTSTATPSASAEAPADPRTDDSRSAFGRVMAVMIAALQQQASQATDATAAAPVRTTAAGTPMDIQVGAAFSDAAPASAAPRTRTAPADLTLSQAALAGPH